MSDGPIDLLIEDILERIRRIGRYTKDLDHDAFVQDHRPVGAHPVDVLIAVDVPYVRALAPHEEPRVGVAVGGAVLVAVHTARHDAPGALPQRMTRGQPAIGRTHRARIIASRCRTELFAVR